LQFLYYLMDFSQVFFVLDIIHRPFPFICGVPKESVMRLPLFGTYTQPLGKIVQKRDIGLYLYARDTQQNLSLHPSVADAAAEKLNDYVTDNYD